MRTVFAALAILFGAALASSGASRNMFFPTASQAPCGSYRKTQAASYSAAISQLTPQNRPAGSPPRQRENHLAAQSKMPLQAVLSGLLAVVAVRSRCVSTARRAGHATAASAAERQERIVNSAVHLIGVGGLGQARRPNFELHVLGCIDANRNESIVVGKRLTSSSR